MATSNAYSTGKIFDGYMGRNVIINGACNVAQRGSVAFGTGVTGYGGPDRYLAANSGSAGGSFTQSTGTISFGGVTKNAVVQTVGTAVASLTTTNFWGGIIQVVEGFNAFPLLGQQVSVSFIFNTNVSGTYSLSLRDGSSSNSYVTTFTATANTPTKYTFLIPTLPTSLSVPNSASAGMYITVGALNNGTYQTGVLGSWISGNFIAAATTNWGASISNFIAVTELQIEEGAIPTPFERESIATTLTKCQRYFLSASTVNTADTFWFSGNVTSGSAYYSNLKFPVTMRTNSTVTLLVAAATSFPTTIGSYSISTATAAGATVACVANATANGSYSVSFTASAEL